MSFLRRGAASGLPTGVRPGWAYPFRVVEDSPIRGCAPAAALEFLYALAWVLFLLFHFNGLGGVLILCLRFTCN
jgi:hypothetical protein